MIGRILGKRYQIVEKVAIGGMSNVYKALDMNLKRYDAVKILKEEFAQNSEFLEQFRQEANSVAGLNHPNIVNIYNVGNEGGLQYIVMEYIKGKTLKKIIKEKGRLFQDQVINYSEQIAKGLQHAHLNGIIHRDVKPQNILITDDDRVKIFDFGIAKHSESSTITNSGRIIGSVHYFSPEQARGLTTDARSDIYSLGIVMYEMITGRLPFDSESPVTIALKHMQEPVIPPKTINPGISDKLNAVIMKAVAKDPIDRYQNMDEMLTDISRIKGPDPLVYSKADSVKGEVPKAQLDSTQVMAPVRTQSPVTAQSRIRNLPPEAEDYEYEYDDISEAEEKEKRRSKGLIALLLVLVVALAGVAVMGATYLNGLRTQQTQTNAPKTMTMINIVGMDEAKAKLELSKYQIKLESSYTVSDSPGGTVLESTPKAGDSVTIGGTVTAVVSKAKETVKVPDFTNMTQAQAEAALTSAGLVRGNVTQAFNDFILNGIVLSSAPAAGQDIEKGKSVDLIVSKGKDPSVMDLVVPDLMGLTADQANASLKAAGLQLGTTSPAQTTDKNLDGKVMSQSLPFSTKVAKDTVINVEIGKFVAASTTTPSTTTPATKPSTTTASTKPSTTTASTTTASTKPSGTLKASDLIGQDYYSAEEIVMSYGLKIEILNLYNPNGSVVKSADVQKLLNQGAINGVVEEVSIGDKKVLVNVMSRIKVD